MKRKMLLLLLTLSFVVMSAFALSACFGSDDNGGGNGTNNGENNTEPVAEIISVEDGTLDKENKTVYFFIDKDTTSFYFSERVLCSTNSKMTCYTDSSCEHGSTVSYTGLRNGNNIYYIKVYDVDNPATYNIYEMTIYKSYSVNITYYNGYNELRTDTVYTGELFKTDYVPDIYGYNFNFWKDADGNKVTDFTPYEATRLYADCTAKTINVSLNVNGGMQLEESTVSVSYAHEFQLPVPVREGYTFAGWYEGDIAITYDNGRNCYYWNDFEDKQCIAKWWINYYALSPRKGDVDGGTITPTKTAYHSYGSDVTVSATTNDGYTWIGWFNENDELVTAQTEYTFTIEQTSNLTAKWACYTVTTQSDDLTAGTVEEFNEIKFTAGNEVSIEAQTNNGYTWIGWYEGDEFISSELSYTFEMPEKSVLYTAKWIKINLASGSNIAGTISSLDDTYVYGEEVTVDAYPYENYKWSGWYDGDTLLTSNTSYTFNMPSENATYTARWESEIPYIDENGSVLYSAADEIEIWSSVVSTEISGRYLFTGKYDGKLGAVYTYSLTVVGEAEIILNGDCNWTLDNIIVSAGNVLKIYGQSDGESVGVLTVKKTIGGSDGTDSYAKETVGGDGEDGGTIIINGGNITAANIGGGAGGTGGNGINGYASTGNGTGIGTLGGTGGTGGKSGQITINGGSVTADYIGGGAGGTGGKGGTGRNESGSNGAGGNGGTGGAGGDCEVITINGGTVYVKRTLGGGTGGSGGAGGTGGYSTGKGGIGGRGGVGGSAGVIKIYGGNIQIGNLGAGAGGEGGRGGVGSYNGRYNGGTGGTGGSGGNGGSGGTLIIGVNVIEKCGNLGGGVRGYYNSGGVGANNEYASSGGYGANGSDVETYYLGNLSEWEQESVVNELGTTIYTYSEDEPAEEGNFWHYDNGEITIW